MRLTSTSLFRAVGEQLKALSKPRDEAEGRMAAGYAYEKACIVEALEGVEEARIQFEVRVFRTSPLGALHQAFFTAFHQYQNV
jgi:hypothetical protein